MSKDTKLFFSAVFGFVAVIGFILIMFMQPVLGIPLLILGISLSDSLYRSAYPEKNRLAYEEGENYD